MNQKTCTRCGIVADEDMFAKTRVLCGVDTQHREDRRPVCKGCEQTAADSRKAVDPWIAKARWTIQHHAKKYGLSYAEFKRRFEWTEGRVAHMLRHAYENTCNYCWQPYSEMRNGPSDVTLDIHDPAKLPDLRTNVVACCRTCNQEKSNKSPEDYGRVLAYWRKYKEHIANLKSTPAWTQIPLWEEGAA